MAGKALVDFQDFVLVTNERVVTSPEEILSEATRNTYLFGEMMNSSTTATSSSRAARRSPTGCSSRRARSSGSTSPTRPSARSSRTLFSNIEVNWRFAKDVWGWTDHEIELNVGERRRRRALHRVQALKKPRRKQACDHRHLRTGWRRAVGDAGEREMETARASARTRSAASSPRTACPWAASRP
jgi:hypothetical protein